MKTLGSLRFLGVTLSLVLGACGGGTASPDGLLFRGEGTLLDGFKFDTGPQPATGPASIALRLSGGGAVKVEARGTIANGKLDGVPGTGHVDLDAHVKLDGTLRVDNGIAKSSGDVPGLEDVDIAIKGTVAFDPFLIGGEGANVTAAIPETKLPDVPLGIVPGKLRLTITSRSQLTSAYAGTCMTVKSGVAQYAGRAITSGKLVLEGTIALALPAPLDREIALPEITVPIPSATSEVVFTTVATEGAEDGSFGTCGGSPPDAGGAGGDSSEAGVADSAPRETSPPACIGEDYEPDALRDDARLLPVISDCDGDAATVTGVLSSDADVDTLRFIGEDTFGCAVNAYAKVTGPVRVCLAPVCTVGDTNLKGCTKGTREGDECCGTEVEASFNCTGTTKDSARVYLTVEPNGAIDACSAYSVKYHY
jgi:hypothetical protein